MATIESGTTDRLMERGWSGDVVGGAVTAVLGLLHVFGLQVGGAIGFLLLLVVWPLIGGGIGSRVERARDGRDWGTTSTLTGVFAALVTAVLVLLAGVAGAWPGFVTTNFGVTLWPVFFTVLVLFTLAWTVSGYAGGFVERQLADRSAAESGHVEDTDEEAETEAVAEE